MRMRSFSVAISRRAIRNASRFVDGPVVIFNGDILSDLNLTEMIRQHRSKKSFVTIALTRVKDPTLFGLVETGKTGRIDSFLEKPSWDEITTNTINAGIYVFEREAVNLIPPGINFSVERGLFPSLLSQKYQLFGYVSKGYWLDIGTIDKYLQANYDMLSGGLVFKPEGRRIKPNLFSGKKLKLGKNIQISGRTICGDNVKLADFVQLRGNNCIGSGVSIGTGTQISDSVILAGSSIHEGARIDKAIVGEKCLIEANASLSPNTTLGNNTVIKKYSRI